MSTNAMTKITTDKMTDARALAAVLTAARRGLPGLEQSLRDAHDYLSARLASTSPAPDGWVLVKEHHLRELAADVRFNAERGDKNRVSGWASELEHMIAAAPQPVVEKDNG